MARRDAWDVSILVSPDLRARRRMEFKTAKSMSFPLLPESGAAVPSGKSQVRAFSVDTLPVQACRREAPQRLQGRARLVRNVFAALVACFMGATDGLSLGGLIFPSSPEHPNHEYQALGMSIGLLTTLVANTGGLLGSEFSFGVAGASIPTVIIFAEHFKRMGPGKCSTIYFMAAVSSMLVGVCIWLVGWLKLARLVKACPFVIYGGFMAGTGAVLLQYALNLMTPGFTSLTDPASYGCLADTQLLQLWVPGAVAGVGMFALRATNVKVPRIPQDLLIPAVLLAEALSFCGWMLVTGRGLEEARAQGLLFNVTLPEHPVFYRVWTKHFDPSGPKVDWQEFAAPSFWLTVVNAACISVLTAVMNIFGTMAATRFRVDIDREMMLHGIYNVGSGALSGLTANMVMSFSITCRTLGADGQQFQVLLFVFSGLVFLFGDYVVAVIPKLLPGSVLIWLSAELMAFWVWNALRFLRPYEYCLVWIMIGLYVVMGTAPMMLFGFIAVAGIVQAQLATLPVIRTRQTLAGKLRSSRLHTTCDREFLNRIGAQAEVWILGAAYLYFASMRQLVQALENFSSQRHVAYQSPKRAEKDEELPEFGFSHAVSCEARLSPEYIIIDLDVVRQMESTAVSAFQEILSVAKEQACVLILARPDPCVLQQMENFQLPLRRLHEAPVPLPEDELGGDALLVAETLDQALEFVEESFLQAYQPAPGQCRGHDHSQIRRRLASFVGPSLALHGVFLDFHVWLDGYFPSYHPQIFEHLAPFLEIRKLQEREVLYRAPPFRSLQRGGAWMCEAEKGKEPPLVWLLQGGADHIWNPNSETEQSVRAFEDMYRLSPGSAFEKARIVEKRGSWCAGPFSTARAFLAGSAHPGTLISTDASTVAILRQQAFEELPGHLRRIVTAYLLRQMPTYVRT